MAVPRKGHHQLRRRGQRPRVSTSRRGRP